MNGHEPTVERAADRENRGGSGPSREPVVVETPSGTRSGRAVDVSGRVDPASVVAAVRASAGDGGERTDVTIDCPEPRPVHDHVGFVRPELSLRVRTALASAARSRGATTAHDEELERVRDRLADLTIPEGADAAAARRRLAGTESAVAQRRERVAALRGRIQAGRDAGRDVSDLRAELADATRELSEHETERAAAEEALERAEERAREARDARERRRRLQDREANLARAARRELVADFREEYATAVERVPGGPTEERVPGEPADGTVASEPAGRTVGRGVTDGTVDGETTGETVAGAATEEATPSGAPPSDDPFDVDPVTAALAVARVAELRAPVVLACDRFDSPTAAADWLDAPVVRV